MAQIFQFRTHSVLHPSLPSSKSIAPFQFHSCLRIRSLTHFHSSPRLRSPNSSSPASFSGARCSDKPIILRTCKICKSQFDPSLNNPQACRFHTAHFGGETKRKFESVYSGGTMNTPNSGQVLEYWHCCGSEDPFDPGCTASPHSSYDD